MQRMKVRGFAVLVLTVSIFSPALGFCAAASGSAAVSIRGSVTVCVDQGTLTPMACTATGAVGVEVKILEVGRVSWSHLGISGTTCAVTNESISVPGTPLTTFAGNASFVGTIMSFDAATGTGTASVVGYSGGSCTGSEFNSAGATKRSTGEVSFVLSEGGKRIDGIATALSVESITLGGITITSPEISAFSLSGDGNKQ
jgi:hypothetical protein